MTRETKKATYVRVIRGVKDVKIHTDYEIVKRLKSIAESLSSGWSCTDEDHIFLQDLEAQLIPDHELLNMYNTAFAMVALRKAKQAKEERKNKH